MMFDSLRKLKQEQVFSLLLAILLHGLVLYALWGVRFYSTENAPTTLIVSLITPPEAANATPQHPPESHTTEPPRTPQQITATTETLPIAADSSPPLPQSAPSEPAQAAPTPLTELAIHCQERHPPDYPTLSVRLNEQGRVVLHVELDVEGRITHVEIKKTSGFHRLDEAAMNTVKTWHCKPAISNGIAAVTTADQPFSFVLEGK